MTDRPAPVLHRADPGVTIWHGHSLDVLRALPDESVHAVVCDPPYGLSNTDTRHVLDTLMKWLGGDREFVPNTGGGFMGNRWDDFVPPPAIWDECFRVLKPGGHVVAFAGSRTYDLMGLSIRLAGFEIRDGLAWLYSQGFPKSLDVSKAIDKMSGSTRISGEPVRDRISHLRNERYASGPSGFSADRGTALSGGAPVSPDAQLWEGWGTALKPAFEPMVLARKPLTGTVAATVLTHGTGALNITATRIGSTGGTRDGSGSAPNRLNEVYGAGMGGNPSDPEFIAGRHPANVLLDPTAAAELDQQTGTLTSGVLQAHHHRGPKTDGIYGEYDRVEGERGYGDSGGASRFFASFRYEAKAPTSERPTYLDADGKQHAHATVKPLDLIRWLVRLITPPGGTIIDPFLGSGTTAEAAIIEGFDFIGIELEGKYLPLIDERLDRGAPSVALEARLSGADVTAHGRLF